MAANTSPIFCLTPHISFANTGTAAATGTDGTAAITVFTAGAQGSKIEDVFIQHLGTNSTASTLRFYVNNGSSSGTPANNALIHEETLAASTISQTAASVGMIWRANIVLPAGYKLLVAPGTALSADCKVTAVGGDY